MRRSLLQLTWREVVNIHSFCLLRNECVFCTCKQRSDRIPDLQGAHFPLHLFIFVLDGFPSNKLFQVCLFFLRKAITGLTEKVFSKALLVFKMDQ